MLNEAVFCETEFLFRLMDLQDPCAPPSTHAGGSLSSALDQVFSVLCQALNILLRNNLGGVRLKNRQINKTIEPAWLCRKSMRNAQGQRSRSHSHILSMVENRLPSHYRAKHLLKDKIVIWNLFVYSPAVFIAFCIFTTKCHYVYFNMNWSLV